MSAERDPDAVVAAGDARLDRELALPGSVDAAVVARRTGLVSVLLAGRLDGSRGALRALLEPIAARLGGALDLATAVPTVRVGTDDVALIAGPGPFPRSELDLRFVPAAHSLGASFVTVVHGVPPYTGPPPLAPQPRISAAPDPWGPDGRLRLRLRLVAELLGAGGVGAIVHQAGDVVLMPDELLRRLGDLGDPAQRGFGALIDLGRTGTQLYTQGMHALGFPDVTLDDAMLGLDDHDAYDRAHAAVLAACHHMVFRDRVLRGRDRLAVPVGCEVGAVPLSPPAAADPVDRYRVVERGARIALVPDAPLAPVARLWHDAVHGGHELDLRAYRALLRGALARVGWRKLHVMNYDALPDGVPAHEVHVMLRPDGHYTTITCGIARRSQPGGRVADDNAFVELVVTAADHAPLLATFLSVLGRLIHAREPGAPPWSPHDRVLLPEGPLVDAGFAAVVLGWADPIELPPGPRICLYAPIPMTAAECAQVPVGRLGAWVDEVGAAACAERWQTVLDAI